MIRHHAARLAFVLALTGCPVAWATGQSSSNFTIPASALNSGVGDMASAGFHLGSSLGDAFFTGPIASANFVLTPGFRRAGEVPAAAAAVVEYYHKVFDHYFITRNPDEIAKLDNGTFVGWARTGLGFNVYAVATAGAASVCRFFSTSFDPKSSHFYTPFPAECAAVKINPNWQYEGAGDEVFYIPLAAGDGTCAAGTSAVYRLYNNGQGAAPNHRYTTSRNVRDQMVAANWVIEGNGPGFAFMCAPQ